MWQEELLYSIVLLLLKINWARFFLHSFLWRCYRLFMLLQDKKTLYWKSCFKNLNKMNSKSMWKVCRLCEGLVGSTAQLLCFISFSEMVCKISFTGRFKWWKTLFCVIGKNHIPLSLKRKWISSNSTVINTILWYVIFPDSTAVFLFVCQKQY